MHNPGLQWEQLSQKGERPEREEEKVETWAWFCFKGHTLQNFCGKSLKDNDSLSKYAVFEAIELMFETLKIRKVGWHNYIKISRSAMLQDWILNC